MNTLIMLVRREVWENRSLWIVPLVIAGVLLLAVSVGGLHINGNNFFIGSGSGAAYGEISPQDHAQIARELEKHDIKTDAAYAVAISALTSIEMSALCFVIFFYLLDCLLQERKDRSILFWKSMPISDTQVVLSKAVTALVLAPLIALAVSAVLQILVGGVVWLRLSQSPIGAILPVWRPMAWLQVQVAYLLLIPTVVLWYLPVAGYLLLVSIWSRRNAFLWAVLPWASLLLIEVMIFQSHRVADFLGRRFTGVIDLMGFGGSSHGEPHLADLTLGNWLAHLGNVYTSIELWISIAAGAALIFATIRIRRYRDDS